LATVKCDGVWKLFGDSAAVVDFDLEVADGEFLVFVGPSGCGKTTSLRMLAGLERPSYGRIWIGEADVTLLPPGKRDVAMVFQSYALYPNMSVEKNLSFGPMVRKDDKAMVPARVRQVAEVLGIDHLLHRRPSELSGGQRQRVALGRALIRQPQLFLLDEPLSNLDAALRVQMRTELIRLHHLLSVTTVYVTHDQVEAMTMGDRVAVMNHGRLLQVDTPAALFDNPRDLFVASFLGSPKMNTLGGRLQRGEHGELTLDCLAQSFALPPAHGSQLLASGPEQIVVGLRPTDIRWAQEATPSCTVRFDSRADVVEQLGAETFATVQVGEEKLVARLPRYCPVRSGDVVSLAFDPEDLYYFDRSSGLSLVQRTVRAGQLSSLDKVG
jgi:multiple sugar transport system ATP-binding protein